MENGKWKVVVENRLVETVFFIPPEGKAQMRRIDGWPPSGREVARLAVTEGACVTDGYRFFNKSVDR